MHYRATSSAATPDGRAAKRTIVITVIAAVAATFEYWLYADRDPEWAEPSTPQGALRVLVANGAAGRVANVALRSLIDCDLRVEDS